ncbi:MAG TPA: ABC transporter substrate-binding protein [Microscillaceae bacterium]|nr:ABC transporter substrate-binding protein [Microscillaceae bacterium]
MNKLVIYLYLVASGFLLVNCTTQPQENSQKQTTDPLTTIQYAQHVTLSYEHNYKVVQVKKAFSGSNQGFTYVLLPEGVNKPAKYAQAQVIRIPVKKIALTSTPPVAYLQWMNAYDLIAAVDKPQYIYDPVLQKILKEKNIPAIGSSKNLNSEVVMNLQPDVLMTSGVSQAAFGKYEQLMKVGIPIIVNSGWLETHPLGRLEWVKLMAALTNQEALVNKKFNEVVKQYQQVTQLAAKAKTRPDIFKGLLFKNTWYANGGKSYLAQLIADAGGSYSWKSNPKTDLLTLDFEAVYPIGLKSSYWLNPGRKIRTKADLLKQDTRYEAFKSFKENNIYNNNHRQNAQGANDYWQSGITNPHIVLKDLVKIFHPELLPDYEMVYHQRIE